MAEQRRPHVVIAAICGVSVGAYALSLSAVARSQADSDKDLIVDREPIQRAIGLLTAHRTALSSTLTLSRQRYASASRDYGDLQDDLKELHGLLQAFGRDMAKLDQAAAGVPTSIRLPGVREIAPVPRADPPPIDGKTGASGKP